MSAEEETIAVQDTYDVIQEYGQPVELVMQAESVRSKDKFGAVKSVNDDTTETVNAFPIRYNPSEKEIKEAGFDERVDVMLFLSSKELSDKSINVDSLRDRMRVRGQQFKLKDIKPHGHFGNSFRSWVVGLVK